MAEVIEGGGEQGEHHKSVLGKVKDKAKKIKDTIKKHGHGHEHEDEYEEMVNDPQVHGAPMYESTVIRSTNLPRETGINVEKSKDTGPGDKPPAMAAREPEYKNVPNVEEPKIKVGPRVGIEEDPHFPYNSRAEVGPVVSQFGNLNVRNVFEEKPEPEQRSGGHDQFDPQETPTCNPVGPGKPDPNPKIQDPASQKTVAGKISASAASTAVSAKNAVASKLGYGGGSQQGQDDSSSKQCVSEVVLGYAANLAEKFRPGDEDKALSEAITDLFTNKKLRVEEGGGRPVGRVTQSEEVTARLGPAAEKKREGEDALAAGAESSGQGVVDRMKDAVGLWFGKSMGMRTAQDSVGGSYVSDVNSASSQAGQGKEIFDRQKE